MNLDQVAAGASPEVPTNENFEAVKAAGAFGQRGSTTSGLTWGYYGADTYNGNAVPSGTVTLTDNATNYVVVLRSTGAVSVSTSSTNSTDPLYARVRKLTTVSGLVTVNVDERLEANGLLLPSVAGGVAADTIWNAAGDIVQGTGSDTAARLALGSASQQLRVNAGATALEYFTPTAGGSTQGRHAVFIAAGSMSPSVTGGCSSLTRVASAANQPDIASVDFDATTQEYAQFYMTMPKSWDEGTVTFAPVWSHAATTTNFGVVFDLQGYAASNDDAIATAFGTAQTSTDTGGTTNDVYMGPESSAITIAGTPAAEDTVFFRISRVTGNGSDTMAIDARLMGIVLYITTNADTDA